ncbi:hypothetical protein HK101_007198 [Irineochytrium annulatum]|nr:hypothetical protein HK101_007198 [Irineochytrium annulatum]
MNPRLKSKSQRRHARSTTTTTTVKPTTTAKTALTPEQKRAAFLALPGVLSATPTSYECHCGKPIKLDKCKPYAKSGYTSHMKGCKGPGGAIYAGFATRQQQHSFLEEPATVHDQRRSFRRSCGEEVTQGIKGRYNEHFFTDHMKVCKGLEARVMTPEHTEALARSKWAAGQVKGVGVAVATMENGFRCHCGDMIQLRGVVNYRDVLHNRVCIRMHMRQCKGPHAVVTEKFGRLPGWIGVDQIEGRTSAVNQINGRSAIAADRVNDGIVSTTCVSIAFTLSLISVIKAGFPTFQDPILENADSQTLLKSREEESGMPPVCDESFLALLADAEAPLGALLPVEGAPLDSDDYPESPVISTYDEDEADESTSLQLPSWDPFPDLPVVLSYDGDAIGGGPSQQPSSPSVAVAVESPAIPSSEFGDDDEPGGRPWLGPPSRETTVTLSDNGHNLRAYDEIEFAVLEEDLKSPAISSPEFCDADEGKNKQQLPSWNTSSESCVNGKTTLQDLPEWDTDGVDECPDSPVISSPVFYDDDEDEMEPEPPSLNTSPEFCDDARPPQDQPSGDIAPAAEEYPDSPVISSFDGNDDGDAASQPSRQPVFHYTLATSFAPTASEPPARQPRQPLPSRDTDLFPSVDDDGPFTKSESDWILLSLHSMCEREGVRPKFDEAGYGGVECKREEEEGEVERRGSASIAPVRKGFTLADILG